jgi:phage head maturation protease
VADRRLKSLRTEALNFRLKNIPGGNRVAWKAEDIARLRAHLDGLSKDALLQVPERAPTAVGKLAEGAGKMSDADTSFVFTISSKRVDLAGDSIDPTGVDFSDFVGNPVVLASHDSQSLPIATSGKPWVSGSTVMAVAKFPAAGINATSDEVATAIRAGLIKGASIGFLPIDWAFSTDRARPLGIDFKKVKLLEWSVCAIPCNPDALLIGPAGSGKAAPTDEAAAIAARRREAREIAGQVRSILKPLTRDERIAEAREFRRVARGGG